MVCTPLTLAKSALRASPLAAALAALLAAPLTAQSVSVVDASGAGDFTSLADATAAASDGDTLLVRSSTPFAWADVLGKGLTIVGDGVVPTLAGTLRIWDMPVASHTIVRGLTFDGSAATALDVQLAHDRGTVWLEDVHSAGLDDLDGLESLDCSTVVLVDSTFAGGTQTFGAGFGGDIVDNGRFFGYATRFDGGDSATFFGAEGLAIEVKQLLLSGCELTGGDTGIGPSTSALYVRTGALTVRVQSSNFTSGTGGAPVPAIQIQSPATTLYTMSEPPRRLTSPSPLREGQTSALDYTGEAGDFVGIFASFEPIGVMQALERGGLHLGGTLATIALLPAPTGSLSLPFTAPNLPVGLDATTLVLQAVAQDDLGLRFSSPTALTFLDASL